VADAEEGCGVNDYTGPVGEYLNYCKKAAAELKLKGSSLDERFHPTADGAVKMVPHNGDKTEARKIREAFRDLTSPSPVSPGAGTA
jgi:hypothetical protein